jgi:hypothetical protein
MDHTRRARRPPATLSLPTAEAPTWQPIAPSSTIPQIKWPQRCRGRVCLRITLPSKLPEGEAILPGLVVARYGSQGYVSSTMLYAFSLPTKANKVPAGTDWIHEIKHDGYRMLVIREQDRVRLSAGAVMIGRIAFR